MNSRQRVIKTQVKSNLGADFSKRFFNTIWRYRICQLTTSQVGRMKETGIAVGLSGGSKEVAPVKSDLQPHSLHLFRGDPTHSLVVAIPKNSEHYRNTMDCKRCSVMVGHTDPQLFQFFKELGTLPPRAVVSGPVEVLSGDLEEEVWQERFITHPVIHRIAQDMWETSESKTEQEQVEIAKREKDEDERRMRRMSSSDWRSKFAERERNPTAEEERESPIYVVKPNTFALLRVLPEATLWTTVSGEVKRVWDPPFPSAPPLCRSGHRFVKMLNATRQQLIPSLNMNYNMKLTNAFISDVDENGLWAMGTEESCTGENRVRQERWAEFRFEFGKDQTITTEQEMEWWIRGLTRLGAPEVNQADANSEDAGTNPEDYDFRHL